MCFLTSYINMKLLTIITKFRLLLVRQQLPESHHQWEAGRWPGGMTDITDVLFIYNFNKKTKETPSMCPHWAQSDSTSHCLPAAVTRTVLRRFLSYMCSAERFLQQCIGCQKITTLIMHPSCSSAQAHSLGLQRAIKLWGLYPTYNPPGLSFCLAKLWLFLERNNKHPSACE